MSARPARQPGKRASHRSYALLLGAQVAIGTAAIFARFALHGAGPIAVSALRLTFAAVPLIAVSLVGARRLERRTEALLALAGAALALHFAAWIGSLLYTSVAISTLLVATTPLWTGVYEALVARRRPTRTDVAALALALGGVALMSAQRNAPAPRAGHALLGAGLALLGALAIGIYFIVVRGALQPGRATPLGTRAVVARTYGWAALFLIGASVAARQGPPAASDAPAWAGIVGMAVFSQLLGHTALNAALRTFTPSIVGMATLLEPVSAALLAAATFHEPVSLQTGLGGVLVLIGVALALGRAPSAATSTL